MRDDTTREAREVRITKRSENGEGTIRERLASLALSHRDTLRVEVRLGGRAGEVRFRIVVGLLETVWCSTLNGAVELAEAVEVKRAK
jgi:hypothetical protein